MTSDRTVLTPLDAQVVDMQGALFLRVTEQHASRIGHNPDAPEDLYLWIHHPQNTDLDPVFYDLAGIYDE